jgi:hypothetical protein
MTAIRLADFLGGLRDKPTARKLTLDEAKKLVRTWIRDIRAETWRATSQTNAPPAVEQQLERALAILEASFSGVLTSITTARRPNSAGERPDPGRGQRPPDDLGRGGGGWGISLPNPFGRAPDPAPPARTEWAQASVYVTSETLYQQLLAACEAIDTLLDLAEPPPPEKEPLPWADDQDLLKELHSLFTALATRNGESALQRLELLQRRLRTRNGIDVVLASEATAHLFKIYPGTDPDDQSYVTVAPAMLTRGRLWCKGEAKGPARADPVQPADDAAAEAEDLGAAGVVADEHLTAAAEAADQGITAPARWGGDNDGEDA